MGFSQLEIEKAFAYIPEAFGRKLIKDMNIKGIFSNKVTVTNTKQEHFEINLDEEKIYRNTTILVNKLTKLIK